MNALVVWNVLRLLMATGSADVVTGGVSVYWPGDAARTGNVMACDRPRLRRVYRRGSIHLAMRSVWRIGCGRKVLVCARATGRCARAPVLDAGPWGVITGSRRRARAEGRYKVWVKQRPPEGWRFRGVADLSRALWTRLGKPRFMTRVTIFIPRRVRWGS